MNDPHARVKTQDHDKHTAVQQNEKEKTMLQKEQNLKGEQTIDASGTGTSQDESNPLNVLEQFVATVLAVALKEWNHDLKEVEAKLLYCKSHGLYPDFQSKTRLPETKKVVRGRPHPSDKVLLNEADQRLAEIIWDFSPESW